MEGVKHYNKMRDENRILFATAEVPPNILTARPCSVGSENTFTIKLNDSEAGTASDPTSVRVSGLLMGVITIHKHLLWLVE